MSDDDLYSTEALRIDIKRYGREGSDQLALVAAEVDILADVLRKGGEHVA